MELISGQEGHSDLVGRVAEAMGAAQADLWPVHGRLKTRLRAEEMYGRAAGAALAVVRQAIQDMDPPEVPIDGVSWVEYRLAVLRMLGGAD